MGDILQYVGTVILDVVATILGAVESILRALVSMIMVLIFNLFDVKGADGNILAGFGLGGISINLSDSDNIFLGIFQGSGLGGATFITDLIQYVIRPVSIALIVILVSVGLYKSIITDKAKESPVKLFLRAVIAVILVTFSYNLLSVVRSVAQGAENMLYTAFLDPMASFTGDGAFTTATADGMVGGIEQAVNIFSGEYNALYSVALGFIALIFPVALTLRYLKTILSYFSKFIRLEILHVFSPLAGAAYASESTQDTTKAYFRMYVSNLLSVILTYGLTLMARSACLITMNTQNMAQLLIYFVMTMALFRIIDKIDMFLDKLRLTNVNVGSSDYLSGFTTIISRQIGRQITDGASTASSAVVGGVTNVISAASGAVGNVAAGVAKGVANGVSGTAKETVGVVRSAAGAVSNVSQEHRDQTIRTAADLSPKQGQAIILKSEQRESKSERRAESMEQIENGKDLETNASFVVADGKGEPGEIRQTDASVASFAAVAGTKMEAVSSNGTVSVTMQNKSGKSIQIARENGKWAIHEGNRRGAVKTFDTFAEAAKYASDHHYTHEADVVNAQGAKHVMAANTENSFLKEDRVEAEKSFMREVQSSVNAMGSASGMIFVANKESMDPEKEEIGISFKMDPDGKVKTTRKDADGTTWTGKYDNMQQAVLAHNSSHIYLKQGNKDIYANGVVKERPKPERNREVLFPPDEAEKNLRQQKIFK